MTEKDGIEGIVEDKKERLGSLKNKLNSFYKLSTSSAFKSELYAGDISKKVLENDVKTEIESLFSLFEIFYIGETTLRRFEAYKKQIYIAYTKPNISSDEANKVMDLFFLKTYNDLYYNM